MGALCFLKAPEIYDLFKSVDEFLWHSTYVGISKKSCPESKCETTMKLKCQLKNLKYVYKVQSGAKHKIFRIVELIVWNSNLNNVVVQIRGLAWAICLNSESITKSPKSYRKSAICNGANYDVLYGLFDQKNQ